MTETEIIIKLLLACLFGGTIGFIRERERKAAGLRTHIMVCLGATLFMLISIYMSIVYKGVDAARIASTVVTGIGFIGAGAIIREGGAVRGLTTAASIWAVAAIGLAVGSGMYAAAITTTIITIVVLQILSLVERKYISPEKGKEE
jgi:putative Mg2+ transporter-C (MgtC) family protein